MGGWSRELRRSLPAIVVSIAPTIVYFAVLGIVLTAAGPNGLDLSEAETSSWIAMLYGLPTVIALVLTLRYRIPLLVTGNIFAIIFFVSLGDQVSFSDLVGASIVAGGVVLAASVLGLTTFIAEWIPAPIVYGLIAGAVMPFVAGIFTSLSTSQDGISIPVEVPVMIAVTLLAYLLSQRLLGTRMPPILAAFIAGIVVAGLTGQLGSFPTSFSLPSFEIVRPTFDLAAIVTAAPVLVALMTVQASIPSVIYLRSQGFRPPETVINVVSGIGTIAGSFWGPVAVSLALPPVLFTASPEAGPRELRYRSVFLPVSAALLIAVFASTAAALAVLVPASLLLATAGLALLGGLVGAIRAIAKGPLIFGPVFAFAISLSQMNVLGLGPFFWSLVLGTAVSLLLERDGWRRLRSEIEEAEREA